MKYTVYNLITGEILRCGDAPSEWCEFQAQNNDEAVHIGFAFDANEFFFDGDAPVRKHAKPSEYYEWDWTTKSWLPNLDAAKAEKKAEIETELDRRLYLPCNGFDADNISRQRISGTIARLQRGDGLPAGWIGWRDASNNMHWATDDAATVLANLTALSRAIEDQEQALLVAGWAHKKNIGDLADLGDILSYDVTKNWPT